MRKINEDILASMEHDIAKAIAGQDSMQQTTDIPSGKIFKEIDRKIRRHAQRRLVVIAAAVMIPILSLNIFFASKAYDWGEQITYNTINVPAGERLKVLLSDGTSVMLNSESTFEYPSKFDQHQRNVKLVKGEGYFEVAHNAKSPFYVKTDQVDIKVLGTKFNVNTYGNDNTVKVFLSEGSVRLTEKMTGDHNSYLIKPGELMSIQKSNGICLLERNVDSKQVDGWMRNQYRFKDAPLAELLKFIERTYGVEFRLSDTSLYRYTYTINFYNESVDDVLKAMERITPIRFVRVNNEITIYPKP